VLSNIIMRHQLPNKSVLIIGDSLADYQASDRAKTSFLGISTDLVDGFPEGVDRMPNLVGFTPYVCM